jgi:aspartyl-tRNA(Asn)/glutamyl-tRNA(Gln) amidotransferase subunit B
MERLLRDQSEDITRVIEDLATGHPDKVRQAIDKPPLRGWFYGQVMKALGGRVNPHLVSEIVNRRLDQ